MANDVTVMRLEDDVYLAARPLVDGPDVRSAAFYVEAHRRNLLVARR